MLKLYLFGSGQAFLDDLPLEGFPTQQAHLLLCYLLLHPKNSYPRDQLAALFWAEYPTEVARKYLRNALWKLRRMFEAAQASWEDYLLIRDEAATFVCTSPYWLDIEVFEAAVSVCRDIRGPDLTAEQMAALERAVALYSGDLLAGVYADWCLYEREHLYLAYLSALGKLVSYHEAHGNFERALTYGARLLERDATRESVHRQMMRLYWLSGDRSAALAQYKRCERILHNELGIAPMPETMLIFQQMVQNQYEPYSLATRARNAASSGPNPASADAASPGVQILAERAMLRLQYLQEMLEETRAELRRIELIIHAELSNSEKIA